MLQRVAKNSACCRKFGVLQRVALQRVAACCSEKRELAVHRSEEREVVMQCVALCCSVLRCLQCVAAKNKG